LVAEGELRLEEALVTREVNTSELLLLGDAIAQFHRLPHEVQHVDAVQVMDVSLDEGHHLLQD
jgi:hypothetical protein